MKKIIILLTLFIVPNAFAQFSNLVLPEEIKTNPDGGPATNFYIASIDYSFEDQDAADEITYMSIRIRPVISKNTKDPDADHLNFRRLIKGFKNYVSANGLTGTYTFTLEMVKDSELPSTAERQAINGNYGYVTRFQVTEYNSPFVPITVLKSGLGAATKEAVNIANPQKTKENSSVKSNKGTEQSQSKALPVAKPKKSNLVKDANKKEPLVASYNVNTSTIIIKSNHFQSRYSIKNEMGLSVISGQISKEIDVDFLLSGDYVLETKNGNFKFSIPDTGNN